MSERVKLIRGEFQDTRGVLLEEERLMRYNKLQQNHCMNNRDKSTFCIVNINMACISIELAHLICDKIEKNQALWIETIKQEMYKPEKRKQHIGLNEEKVMNPYEILLI